MDEIRHQVIYRDKYEWRTLEPRAKPITWRDWWSIVRGRYQPELYLVLVTHLTMAGWDRELKTHYIKPLAEALNENRPMLDFIKDRDE